MRNPKRVEEILKIIRDIWIQQPDVRSINL